VALLRERLPDHLDAKLVIACHRVAALVVGNPEALLEARRTLGHQNRFTGRQDYPLPGERPEDRQIQPLGVPHRLDPQPGEAGASHIVEPLLEAASSITKEVAYLLGEAA
jgi:hypothetical protein